MVRSQCHVLGIGTTTPTGCRSANKQVQNFLQLIFYFDVSSSRPPFPGRDREILARLPAGPPAAAWSKSKLPWTSTPMHVSFFTEALNVMLGCGLASASS